MSTMTDTASPSAGARLRALPHAVRRNAYRLVPPSRRIKGLGGASGRGLLQLRKLVAPLWQRPVTLVSPHGVRLRVTADPVDEQIAQHVLGPHRSDYFPTPPPELPRDACILDVGAHHGFYAAVALREYPDAHLICVEPSRRAIAELKANLDLNDTYGRVRIVDAALAPATGHGELRHTDEGSWGSSLYEEASAAISTESVRLATLAEILGDERPAIVKCNAEGAEFALIAHLSTTDLRPEFMVVMVHPEFGDVDALLATAERMGYRTVPVGTAHRPAFQMWRAPE
jgi:FkbM family methyltransferase